MNYRTAAEQFLEIAPQFRLGELDTEKPHPGTRDLSRLVEQDLPRAIHVLKEIDLDALEVIRKCSTQIGAMKASAEEVLERGNRIFLVGCGATGRLSLVLEVLWRKEDYAIITFSL